MADAETHPALPAGDAPGPSGPARLFGHPLAVGVVFGLAGGWIAHDAPIGLGAGIGMSLLVWAARALRSRHANRASMVDALTKAGATHVGYSATDRRGIGYDALTRTLILGQDAGRVVRTSLHPLASVRDVSWDRPEPSLVPVMGVHGSSAVMQANAANAASERSARDASGLRIVLDDTALPSFRIALDADAKRMQAWSDLIRKAAAGEVAVPGGTQAL